MSNSRSPQCDQNVQKLESIDKNFTNQVNFLDERETRLKEEIKTIQQDKGFVFKCKI